MPTFEGTCATGKCSDFGVTFEYLLRKWDDPDPKCPECGKRVKRAFSAPNISWAKPLGEYCGEHSEGHFGTSRNDETGEVTKEFIATRKQQLAFCKRNGFHDPADLDKDVKPDRLSKLQAPGEKGQMATAGEVNRWI